MRSDANVLILTALATLATGCLKPNLAFDPATGGPVTGSTADGESTDTPTGGGTSLGPSTGLAGSTGGTSGLGTTGVGPGSTGMSSETGSTTGGPTDCWDLPLDAFAIESLQTDVLDAASPSLSPDGLDLYFKAPVALPTLFEVRRLSRASPADAFAGPSATFFGPPDTSELDYPEVAVGATRIFFTQKGGDIYRADWQGGVWQGWKIAGTTTVFDPQDLESHPNATEDGALLLFQRQDGPTVGPLGTSYNFYQVPFDAQLNEFVATPLEVTPKDPNLVIPVCPAMSPDGLHLLFAAKDAAGDINNFNDGSVGGWSARRASPDAPWDPPLRGATLREPGWITCPSSITADGCQATLIRFMSPGEGYTMHLARRG